MASHAAQRARVLAPKKKPPVYIVPIGTTELIPSVSVPPEN